MPGLRRACLGAAAVVVALASGMARAQLMIVGNDEKIAFADGKVVMQAPGRDSLSIIDMSKPAALRMVATIPLNNSIAGPPTNLAITPNRELALVASSLNNAEKDGKFVSAPDDRIFVIDLKANPPKVITTLTLGKQPSGLAINAAGTLALVTNRGDGTISVLSIAGKEVKLTDTVTIGTGADNVSAVAITPDSKRALAVKSAVDKIAVLAIDGGKVTYDKKDDLPGNNFPYNVAITPNGKIALVANTGNGGSADGNLDTVSVIDLEAKPIRIIDHITVGDQPEGLAISPKGNLAITVEARGSQRSKDTWFYHPVGDVTVLRIDGKKVTRLGQVDVGVFPEAGVFSADGSHVYVGNFIGKNLTVLRVSGGRLIDAGYTYALPGQPASMRGGPQ